jgi:succinate dehydrogenase / fumarate reductase cytochrome b subunit
MTKVDEPPKVGRSAAPRPDGAPARRREPPFLVTFYRSAVAKKWLMAVSGIILIGYVVAHMIGNLKLFLGANHLNEYAEWLRDLGEPALPHSFVLWTMRVVLIAAFVVHIVAAAQLTVMNRRARPERYQGGRDYVVASYASRTMRWTGIIIGLFVLFHLLDLTWGPANPDFHRGDVYNNVVQSFERVPVAIVYIAANIALGIHLFHGAWSMFQSLGWNSPRYNQWRKYFAWTLAAVVTIGNVSMPLMVVTGMVG